MDWDKLRVFHTVGLHKSLTRAGEVMNLSQSAVSRQISSLEEKIGLPLFHRHARGLVLTEHGEILFRTVSEMVTKLEATEISLADATLKPKGPFKLTVPMTFGTMWLAAQMKEYCELYPDIQMTLLCEDRELDLTTREADAAIRFQPTKHPDLVQIPMMRLQNSLFASNDYLRIHGLPTSIEDLANHRLLGFDSSVSNAPFPQVNWLFEMSNAPLKPYVSANSLLALRTMVKRGMGIAALPDYLLHRSRHVSRVLEHIEAPVTEAWYVYPVELKNSKRINVFRSFITEKIAQSNLALV
jgi:DNA-binding transcriptional LysR family regulator